MINWIRIKHFLGAELQHARVEDTELYRVSDDKIAVILENYDLAQAAFAAGVEAALVPYVDDLGQVTYVESGRDCDCVEYTGRKHRVDGTYKAYCDLDDRISEWADGPFRLDPVLPSEAKDITYSSRDLVLEAMEEDHPHSVVSRFP